MDRLANRYDVGELLGHGGMARVYRATDRLLSREVALKQLVSDRSAPLQASVAALFEREFHTLVQLRHPHVIEVYDYGVSDDGSPFYTMELLDSGDLRDRTPIHWQEACRLSFDVCSALALLHSRRMLHRDVSPRNIRRTPHGRAKLIDFGAMAPMTTGGAEVVGTPAFTAPETLQRLALDARTDLFSLGTTLYYALTARLPYPVRVFAELHSAWRIKPPAPSALVADIPAALDDLVLGMISLEPELRPQSAFDVMQRLAACAELRATETEAVANAYLSTPVLVGREDVLVRVRDELRDSRVRVAGLMFEGPTGAGRSRLLDACALEAQTRGFTVLRATASGARESLSIAQALTNHLLDGLQYGAGSAEFPELFASAPVANDNTTEPSSTFRLALRSFADPAIDRARLQRTLRHFWTSVSRAHPLLIAVDDVHKIDEPSAALLAELIDKTEHGGILIALTADSEDRSSAALRALSRRCTSLSLAPLTLDQTHRLLGSLFGDVTHLANLAREIHSVALGNPRRTMELAQHLVDHELIRYTSGSWTLPRLLSTDDLPRSAAAAMHARIARLSPEARFLAEAQALAFYEKFTDRDYRALLPSLSSAEIELALTELSTAEALLRDGAAYMLANRVWVSALLSELDPEQSSVRHRALASMYRAPGSLAFIHHAFLGDLDQEALEALGARNELHRTEADLLKLIDQNVGKLAWCYPRAIATAQALSCSAREIHDLRRWEFLGAVVTEDVPDRDSARLWRDQLIHDSGLDLYRRDSENANPADRLQRALEGAYRRYLATPEHERVYAVDEAIRKLGEYVVISLALRSRLLDATLSMELPDLIEPFVSLSPLLDAIWNNAIASRDCHCFCLYESARARWRETLAKLEHVRENETFVEGMRNAIVYAIGMMEAQLGLATAADLAGRLDRDPYQRVSALDLRRIVRLEQGDSVGADRLRRQAEVLALQQRVPSMFKTLLSVELTAYAHNRDLGGVAYVIEQLKPLAARYPAWRANLLVAEGSFDVVRGDLEAARSKFEQSIELTRFEGDDYSPQLAMWIGAQAGLAACLLGLGHPEDARDVARSALTICESRQIVAAAFDLVRTLAQAEARSGDAGAAQRLEKLIAIQTGLGATGLRLGLSYEARARVAIWSGDAAAFEQFAELTAREYRHGAHTSLAARYERLINEAARCGLRSRVALEDFAALVAADADSLVGDELLTVIARTFAGSRSSEDRRQLALQMVCSAYGARLGHLYLLTPTGPVLRASLGSETPPAELAEFVTHYVTDKRQRSIDLDDMITGDLQHDEALTSLMHTAVAKYELLPLGCVVDSISMFVGVAVIEVPEIRVHNERQTQLLNALATNLLQSGDSSGVRLTPNA